MKFTGAYNQRLPKTEGLNVIKHGQKLGESGSEKESYWSVYKHSDKYFISLNDDYDHVWEADEEDANAYNEIPTTKTETMEFKGTKGPWRVDPYNKISIVDNAKGFHNLIAQVNGKSGEEREANSKLIAVAPELLEALKHCLQIMEECNIPEHLMETYGNAHMNYSGLIKKVTE